MKWFGSSKLFPICLPKWQCSLIFLFLINNPDDRDITSFNTQEHQFNIRGKIRSAIIVLNWFESEVSFWHLLLPTYFYFANIDSSTGAEREFMDVLAGGPDLIWNKWTTKQKKFHSLYASAFYLILRNFITIKAFLIIRGFK